MIIETYEIEEKVGEAIGTTPEVEAEALQLIEDLGLDGQKSLVVKDDEGGESRIPYPEMTKQEIVVYKIRFPVQDKAQEYSMGILPIRILQVVKHAKELFDRVYIWHDKVRDPDPILIGKIGEKHYLLARWGEALAPFKQIMEEAREKLREEWLHKGAALKIKIDSWLGTDLETRLTEKLNGEWVYEPW
jgi:hypothetical protein